jgi:hypothetical protein
VHSHIFSPSDALGFHSLLTSSVDWFLYITLGLFQTRGRSAGRYIKIERESLYRGRSATFTILLLFMRFQILVSKRNRVFHIPPEVRNKRKGAPIVVSVRIHQSGNLVSCSWVSIIAAAYNKVLIMLGSAPWESNLSFSQDIRNRTLDDTPSRIDRVTKQEKWNPGILSLGL